jgi:hypothetical protein
MGDADEQTCNHLQELLLHMHPALAGVVVPTVTLILLSC